MELIIPLLTIIFGALSAYLKANEKIRNSSIKYITEAEELYKDVSKAGGQKFSWVVDTLYNFIPRPLRIIFTKSCIEKIVQSTFNGIEAYAKTQMDKAVDKYFENIENKNLLKRQENDDVG
ncbi:MAG: hypothetical protein SA378_04605 [Sedimentibacter sp.]|uniref:hypothetical protein n=1 Tax=Sedimentibacter sp. TaxID=1960295 RepID=UPI00298161F6|nr:hypothetical protein [Sedimentibacter sp.]MDW5299401.1 hypothetical protein [Sedimentibacter sp.]